MKWVLFTIFGILFLVIYCFLNIPNSDAHILPAVRYNLPEPFMLGIMDYYEIGSNFVVIYYPGRGTTPKGARWHVSQIVNQCLWNCSVFVYDQFSKQSQMLLTAKRDTKIVLYGQSLGTHTALKHFQEYKNLYPNLYIILENPYTSIGSFFWFTPLDDLLFDAYNNRYLAKTVDVPILVVTSELDLVVPPYMSTELLKLMPSKDKTHQIIHGAGHGHAMVGTKLTDWFFRHQL